MPSIVKWLKIVVSNLEKSVDEYAWCPFQWWLASYLITKHCSYITASLEMSCCYTTNMAHEPTISLCWTCLSQMSLQMWISWVSMARILIQLLVQRAENKPTGRLFMYTHMHERGFMETLQSPVSPLQHTWFGYAGDLPPNVLVYRGSVPHLAMKGRD